VPDDLSWVARREARQRQKSIPLALAAVGFAVVLATKIGVVAAFATVLATILVIAAGAFGLFARGRRRADADRRAGRPPAATAAVTLDTIRSLCPGVSHRGSGKPRGHDVLYTGRLIVLPGQLRWELDPGRGIGGSFSKLEPLIWKREEVTGVNFQRSSALYPASYLTLSSAAASFTLVIFDAARVKSDIEALFAVQRPSDALSAPADVVGNRSSA
jgi:hypothetical protein